MKFQPISNHISVESTNYDKDSEKKGEQRSKIVRNNIDYDTKIKPLFFMNRYVEYSYQDKGDNFMKAVIYSEICLKKNNKRPESRIIYN